MDYQTIWKETENKPWCALVTVGRVGTDFFQSLLDSHPEIYVFNGIFFFYEFWEQSYCSKNCTIHNVDDLINEFYGFFIYKFKSKYDFQERKNELGEEKNQFIDINEKIFKEHLRNLIILKPITTRYFLQSVYIAYSLCLKQDITKKKLFFHHVHHIWKLDPYLHDFPGSKILSMTRDPRATYVSGVEHWRIYDPKTDTSGHVFFVLNRTIEDAQSVLKYNKDFKVLRLEDTGNDKVLNEVCKWLGVSYDTCLKQSTWGGLRWWGDRLSKKKISKHESGFSSSIIKNKWESRLNWIDKFLLGFLLSGRLNQFGYQNSNSQKWYKWIVVPFFIPIPTVYERRYLSITYLYQKIKNRDLRTIVKVFYFYLKRVRLFYRLLLSKIKGISPDLPVFKI